MVGGHLRHQLQHSSLAVMVLVVMVGLASDLWLTSLHDTLAKGKAECLSAVVKLARYFENIPK